MHDRNHVLFEGGDGGFREGRGINRDADSVWADSIRCDIGTKKLIFLQ